MSDKTSNDINSVNDLMGSNPEFIKIQLLKEILITLKQIEINTRKV